MNPSPSVPLRQRGAALLVLLLALGLVAAYFGLSAYNRALHNERTKINAETLQQAREALLGAADIDLDAHSKGLITDESFGRLPCPDVTQLPNPGGQASVAPDCPATARSTLGRLPWRTLGLPPLRDNAGECLWYAVSGSIKNNTTPMPALNWDTLGQFIVQDAGGNILAGKTPHEQALAVLLAPAHALGGQSRPTSGSPPPECGGTANTNNNASYLEGAGSPWPQALAATTTLTIADITSFSTGSNNDSAQWITPAGLFDRVKHRSSFTKNINQMIDNIVTCASSVTPVPPSYPAFKGLGNRSSPPAHNLLDDIWSCASDQQKALLTHWQNNLLYTRPGTDSTILLNNGVTYSGCTAVLLFGGERTATQTRASISQVGSDSTPGDPAQYLEGTNASLFPAAGTYTGNARYNPNSGSTDIARCIKPYSGQQASFANDMGSFASSGVGVITGVSDGSSPPGVAAGLNTVRFNNAAGSSGGCFWYPTVLQLSGKVLRAYYEFWFSDADPSGGADRGNGFTLQLVRGDLGSPSLPANPPGEQCGLQTNMGALASGDPRGVISYLVETDVHQDAGNNDPAENHTALLRNGNLTHSLTNGNPTAACNGTAAGCRHQPADTFEESPTPKLHRQRIEIHTGCDATCSNCNAAAPLASNSSRLTVWVDCSDCQDISADLDRSATPPTVQRCYTPNPEMNSVYLGLTAGMRSGASQQSVTLWNFDLRTE